MPTKATIIKHTLTIEFMCSEKNKTFSQCIKNPSISEGHYYSDWSYKKVEFKCNLCGKNHTFEI